MMESDRVQVLESIKQELLDKNFVVVPQRTVVELLLLDPGTHDDSQAFRGTYWPRTIAQTDQNGRPVYPHKRSMVSYYASDGQRTSGAETSTEFIDPTTEVPSDEAWTRTHIAWPQAADVDANLVAMRAMLMALLSAVTGEPLAGYEAMQTAFRVVFDMQADEDGDPGPEGVHQDSADVTAILLVGRDNVQGGVNRVWTLDQPSGKSCDADLTSGRLLLETTLLHPMDMLILCDREVRHEVTSVAPQDAMHRALRDVLTYELRRAPLDGRGGS